ncbi:I78 family peptidase inhibitor [uncultured Litoreibacter sp.]|uniref:I78 family peptidase inhibitor n=1 Tax=uncultured Litoreibacter sp. TaxID=1392394 RepID=UPI0026029A99|nr:I78 family peptidase inhibitor [uncultured Litoreibacter sp.]
MARVVFAGLFAAGFLAACGQPNADPAEYDGVPTCGAETFQNLLGRNESVLSSVTLPRATRILRPGDAISFDFSPDRLTIDIDEFGRVSSVTCR